MTASIHPRDSQPDELSLDESLLARVRESHAHDHADEIDDPTLGMASASGMQGGRVVGGIGGLHPSEYPMSVLEQMQRDEEAREQAEHVIRVVGRINKYGMRAATGQRVHHRREH